MSRFDLPTLAWGIVVIALGGIVLLNRLRILHFSFDAFAVIALTMIGTALLVEGLAGRNRA
jgi:hypothetical protein